MYSNIYVNLVEVTQFFFYRQKSYSVVWHFGTGHPMIHNTQIAQAGWVIETRVFIYVRRDRSFPPDGKDNYVFFKKSSLDDEGLFPSYLHHHHLIYVDVIQIGLTLVLWGNLTPHISRRVHN